MSVSMDKAVGALLLGTYLNSLFFAVEINQVIHYFQRHYRDPLAVKLTITFVFFIDIIGTLSAYICVYLYSITHWGDAEYLRYQNWTIISHLITTGITAAIVQSFMVYRYWRLTGHHLISILLTALTLAGIAGAIGTAADIIMHREFSQRRTASVFVSLWLMASTAADVGIAASLVWRLLRAKSPESSASTLSLIKRLVTSTISTGTTTSIIAIFALFAYLHEPQSNVVIGVTFLLGRVYACTLLYTLNNRSKLQQKDKAEPHCMTFGLGGIVIQRTAVVTHDLRARANSAASEKAVVRPAIVVNDKHVDLVETSGIETPFSDLPLLEDGSIPRQSNVSNLSWSSDTTAMLTPPPSPTTPCSP